MILFNNVLIADCVQLEITLEFWGYTASGEKTKTPLEIRQLNETVAVDRNRKDGGRYLSELADGAVKKLRKKIAQKNPKSFWIKNHQCFSWNYFMKNKFLYPQSPFPLGKVLKITGKNFFRPKVAKQAPKNICIKNRAAWRNFVQLKKKKSRKRKNRQKNRKDRLEQLKSDQERENGGRWSDMDAIDPRFDDMEGRWSEN